MGGGLEITKTTLRLGVAMSDLWLPRSIRNLVTYATWHRSAVGYRKIDGRWMVMHEHFSVPFYMDGSDKAAGLIGRSLTSTFNFVPKYFFSRGFAQRHAPEVLAMCLAPRRDPTRRTAMVIAPGSS